MSDLINKEAEQKDTEKSISYWGDAWRRFKRNKMALAGFIFICFIFFTSIAAPLIAPYKYYEPHYEYAFSKPSLKFLFGTDDLGRDMLSRLIYGLRNALLVGIGSQVLVLSIGVMLGALSGFHGGKLDTFIMRVVDIMFAFPTFLFNVILVTILGRSILTIILAIGLVNWAGVARLVRGQIMVLKQAEFVEAARAIGAKNSHIIRKYLLPNTLGPIIVSFAFGMSGAIWIESGMAVVGLGLRPPMPSLGNLIGSGLQMFLGYPHLLFWPAIIFALTLLSFTFVGDGLQDAFNPRSET